MSRVCCSRKLGRSRVTKRINCSQSSISHVLARTQRAKVMRVAVKRPLRQLRSLRRGLQGGCKLGAMHITCSCSSDVTSALIPRYTTRLLIRGLGPSSLVIASAKAPVTTAVETLPPLSCPHTRIARVLNSLSSTGSLASSPRVYQVVTRHLKYTCSLLPTPLVVKSTRITRTIHSRGLVTVALTLNGQTSVTVINMKTVQRKRSKEVFRSFRSTTMTQRLRRGKIIKRVYKRRVSVRNGRIQADLYRHAVDVSFRQFHSVPLIVKIT